MLQAIRKKYHVLPNTKGYLFRDHVLSAEWEPGIYTCWDWQNRTSLYCLPTTTRLLTATNQEVLAKDNVALRFSFQVLYRITDGKKFLRCFALGHELHYVLYEAEQRIHQMAQQVLRERIAAWDSESLNEKRAELADFRTDRLAEQAGELGITIEEAALRDLTFPKAIQELFAKQLEAKIRAKAELENARTVVATARALKNASELMKGDDNIRFVQYLETLLKIADKGKHTFVIGEAPFSTSK